MVTLTKLKIGKRSVLRLQPLFLSFFKYFVLFFFFNYFCLFQFFVILIALGVGSTHMVSLDGTEYTFGGYGEYHVLQIPSIAFELQGRMQPFNNYSSILGTVFTAFAMKERGSDVVQVI